VAETLQQDDATRLRARAYRAEVIMVCTAALAFAGMGLVRWWTKREMSGATTVCGPPEVCRDTFIKHYLGDVVCPREDQTIEAVTSADGFFCRCRRVK
jgi:hypothetical protein